tara:strand:- start:211 stop:906 length:696 start_codon:yes stop_codon:yes gene_type:complete
LIIIEVILCIIDEYIDLKETVTHCRLCNRDTNHIVHGYHKPDPVLDDDTGVENFDEYYIVQCKGCDTIGFLHSSWNSEEEKEDDFYKYDLHYPEDTDRYIYYQFLSEDEQAELPKDLYYFYDELKSAFNNETDTLAGVAIRMVVDAVCLNLKITGRNLQVKITKLFEMGYISKNEQEVLDRLREIGNVSAHKIKSPTATELEATLEAANHLLRSVYVVHKRTKRLRKNKRE